VDARRQGGPFPRDRAKTAAPRSRSGLRFRGRRRASVRVVRALNHGVKWVNARDHQQLDRSCPASRPALPRARTTPTHNRRRADRRAVRIPRCRNLAGPARPFPESNPAICQTEYFIPRPFQPDKGGCYDFFKVDLFKARLIAVLAFTLMWSSAQCVAACANEPSASAGTASTEPPCHHHAPSSQTPATCAKQQLPQADVRRPLEALTSIASLAAINVAGVPFIRFPLPAAACALPMLDVLWPPGLAVPPVVILRI
jgi:hypothetical protein